MNTVEHKRRTVIKGALATGLLGLAASWGLLGNLAYAARPQAAFDAEDVPEALKALFGDQAAQENGMVTVKAPDIAENGAVVPVRVTANMQNVESIAIIVPKNPAPMVASFDLQPGTIPEVSVRIKMGTTSDVIALVKSNGQVLSAAKEVKVTIGGCGG